MRGLAGRLKGTLNRRATARLQRRGYSDAMVSDAKREAWWWLQARAGALAKRRPRLFGGSAVVWTGAGRAELVPVEVLAPRSGEITVEAVATIVSPGTERAQYLRLPNARIDFPHRPGYSGSGIVVASGSGTRFVRGDRVAVSGFHHASVETVRANTAYRIPEGVAFEDAALVQLGVICLQGVRRAELATGRPVAVVGSGLVGTLALRLGRALGAGESTVIARSRRKEQTARAGGASDFLVVGEDDGAIDALGAPAVIEAAGDPDALGVAVRAAAPGGVVVLLGSPRGATADVPVDAIRDKRLRIVGAHVETLAYEAERHEDRYHTDADAFLRLLAEGTVDVDDLVELVVDPREPDSFYRMLARSADIVGARFDWTRLSAPERVRQARFLRRPDLAARGADAARPIARRADGPVEIDDPLADAVGMLRIALVGCGDIALHNARGIEQAPNAELVACYDPVSALAEDLAERFGADAVPTFEQALARDDVDAVFLAVPHHLHEPLGAQAAEAGKHLIVEKPLANDLSAAGRLVAAAERAGVVLSVCFPQRYEARALVARRLVAEGALGELAGTFTLFLAEKPPSYWLGGYSGRAVTSWRSSREQAGGGVLIMNLSHYVDLVRYVTGVEVDEVSALVNVVDRPAEVEDTVSITIGYANGAVGTLLGCAALRGASVATRVDVWGTDGRLLIEPEAEVFTLRSVAGLRTSRWHSYAGAGPADIRARYVASLASAIQRGWPADVSAADALAVQAFIEAAYRSAESGERVRPSDLLKEARV